MKKETKKWCVIATHFDYPYFDEYSISGKRTNSIDKFMKDAYWKTWCQWKREGWKCVRVSMTLEVI